jgi:multidrug efflux pump subunit AcrA (membrane-fusion protein)
MHGRIKHPALKCFILLAAGIVTALGCSKPSSAAKKTEPKKAVDPAIAVTVAPVTFRSIQRTADVVGTFFGREEVTIAPKTTGRIVKIHHDVGDIVRPGEVLLEIDDTDYRLAAEETQKALESELARLGLSQLPTQDVDIDKLPSVVRARLLEENAARKLQRIETLAAKNVSTQDELDQVRTDHRVAQANYKQAAMDARSTLATARHRNAILSTAVQRWHDTKVVVPTPSSQTGPNQADYFFVVAKRLVSEGEMVQSMPSTEVFRLVMDNPLKLVATVPERHVGELKMGQSAVISVEAYPGMSFPGQVSRINPTVDSASRTFQIEVLVPNESRQLKAGSFAKAAILTREDSQARTVPEESLVTFAGINKVFVIRDGKAFPIEVRAGVRGGNWLEITSELPAGALVVTSGATQLADGTAVRILPIASKETPLHR